MDVGGLVSTLGVVKIGSDRIGPLQLFRIEFFTRLSVLLATSGPTPPGESQSRTRAGARDPNEGFWNDSLEDIYFSEQSIILQHRPP